jgi:hypothetical protein
MPRPDALGHVVSRQLEVYAVETRSARFVHVERRLLPECAEANLGR